MARLLIVAALSLALLWPSAAAAQDRLTCVGYPESRQFIDAQSWWNLPGQPPSHAHLGACIPERENHTGNLRFDVRMVMHDMPASAIYRYLAFVVKGPGYEKTVASFDPQFRCAVGVRTCETWLTYTLPISSFSRSGLQEIRLRASVSPVDGNSARPSLNWPTYVWNGKTRGDVTRMPYVRGKGWYGSGGRDFGYCEAAYRSDVTPLPDLPVSPLWSPLLRLLDHGSGDVDPTHHTVTLDPDFHAVPPAEGTVLKDGAGGWEGTLTPNATPGPHRLHLRAECTDSRGANQGVLVVPFTAG